MSEKGSKLICVMLWASERKPTNNTMKKINSQIRHLLTFLAGIGTYFLGLNLIDAESAEKLNAAGKDLIEPLMIFFSVLAVALSRSAMIWLGQRVPALKNLLGQSDDVKSPSGGGGSLPLGILLVCAISLLCLPSCGTGLTGSLSYRDANSGAKGGLAFDGEGLPHGFIRVPIYDPETGKLLGQADLNGSLAGEIQATK